MDAELKGLEDDSGLLARIVDDDESLDPYNSETCKGRGIMAAGPYLPQSSHSLSEDSSFNGAIERKELRGSGVTRVTLRDYC